MESGLRIDFNLGFSNNFNQLLNVLIAPVTAIMTALVYLKARYAGGEQPGSKSELEDNDQITRSRWQAKMSTPKISQSAPRDII